VKLITLMTDFGLRDGYTGVMQGVIYRIAPDVRITDISHLIRPQNVQEGGLVWGRSYPFFPEGTIHVGVVDPGVGTQRRPIAARLGAHFFVCPDNGLLTVPLEQAEQAGAQVEIVHLDQPRFWLPDVSNVFHGRDIFSPVAAHLAKGTALQELGSPINDPVRLQVPRPAQLANGWRGAIISVDHFGNLGTNLTGQQLSHLKNPRVRLGRYEIEGISRTFGDRPAGEPVALIDSDGNLAICVVNGDASKEMGINTGEIVEVVE
jgi:S-adenosyl-L-methionine hydrolase (adenosine-forming)